MPGPHGSLKLKMHLPDGFLSTPVWGGLGVVSLGAVTLAARKAQAGSGDSRAPLLGVMGAFVFAAQMINFPVGVAASSHLVGAALLSYTVGPWAATVVMSAILVIQALIFQDGGVTALGANIFNMAVAGVALGYLPYRLLAGSWRRVGILAGGFLSVFVASAFTLGELLLSRVPLSSHALAGALGIFALTGAIEGVITLAVVEAIERVNPQWVERPEPMQRLARAVLVSSVALAGGAFWFASPMPDWLERLAERAGFQQLAKTVWPSIFPDYEASFLGTPWLRRSFAGLLGLVATYAVCYVVGRWITRWRSA